jgi:hypothetical protein
MLKITSTTAEGLYFHPIARGLNAIHERCEASENMGIIPLMFDEIFSSGSSAADSNGDPVFCHQVTLRVCLVRLAFYAERMNERISGSAMRLYRDYPRLLYGGNCPDISHPARAEMHDTQATRANNFLENGFSGVYGDVDTFSQVLSCMLVFSNASLDGRRMKLKSMVDITVESARVPRGILYQTKERKKIFASFIDRLSDPKGPSSLVADIRSMRLPPTLERRITDALPSEYERQLRCKVVQINAVKDACRLTVSQIKAIYQLRTFFNGFIYIVEGVVRGVTEDVHDEKYETYYDRISKQEKLKLKESA